MEAIVLISTNSPNGEIYYADALGFWYEDFEFESEMIFDRSWEDFGPGVEEETEEENYFDPALGILRFRILLKDWLDREDDDEPAEDWVKLKGKARVKKDMEGILGFLETAKENGWGWNYRLHFAE